MYFYGIIKPIKAIFQKINVKLSILPDLSIIVPVYNGEQTLARCLDSIQLNPKTSYEIICVNDGSKDHTKEIIATCRRHNHHIKVINLKYNSGLFHARLAGVKKARGRYLGFVDSDDYVDPAYFDKLLNAAKQNSADIAVGGIIMQNQNGENYVQPNCFVFPYLPNPKDQNRSIKELFWSEASRCYPWYVVWNKIYKTKLWKQNLSIFSRNLRHQVSGEEIIFSTFIMPNVKTYAVNPTAHYYYVQSDSSSTNTHHNANALRKKINDTISSFDFVEKNLIATSQDQIMRTGFLNWKKRAARYWERSLYSNRYLPITERNLCSLKLEKLAGGNIENISKADDYYYSNIIRTD